MRVSSISLILNLLKLKIFNVQKFKQKKVDHFRSNNFAASQFSSLLSFATNHRNTRRTRTYRRSKCRSITSAKKFYVHYFYCNCHYA